MMTLICGTTPDATAPFDKPILGSAAVPQRIPPKAAGSASTVYASSSVPPPVIPQARAPHASGGPVKARVNGVENGHGAPAPRNGEKL